MTDRDSNGQDFEFLTCEEVAKLLKLGESTVYALCDRNEIPNVRIGRSVRIPRRELEQWLTQSVRGN
jgi:excisionase family DNA binding protein